MEEFSKNNSEQINTYREKIMHNEKQYQHILNEFEQQKNYVESMVHLNQWDFY